MTYGNGYRGGLTQHGGTSSNAVHHGMNASSPGPAVVGVIAAVVGTLVLVDPHPRNLTLWLLPSSGHQCQDLLSK
ncbi:Hypothetical protein FKW44_017823 [Caligus rogercresseyi]|uniref:Uncharacterized protein n=1 Tax=Caligus rogercresseyi TaxID=217165 RepID=A0A7T8GTY6_CALRO|nr:Hypothetical protein FKW44_017823 [Caligus rogercresseyi]